MTIERDRAPLASHETPSAIDNAACVSETIGNDAAVGEARVIKDGEVVAQLMPGDSYVADAAVGECRHVWNAVSTMDLTAFCINCGIKGDGSPYLVPYHQLAAANAEIERLRGEATLAEERADVIHEQDTLLAQMAEALKEIAIMDSTPVSVTTSPSYKSLGPFADVAIPAIRAYEAHREAK